MIRSWVSRPLLNPGMIKRRHASVDELLKESIARAEIIRVLRSVGDIERLIGKIVFGSANCRDLAALASSAQCLPELTELLSPMETAILSELRGMDTLSDIKDLIDRAIIDEPPFSVR